MPVLPRCGFVGPSYGQARAIAYPRGRRSCREYRSRFLRTRARLAVLFSLEAPAFPLSKVLKNLILYLVIRDFQYFKTSTLISYERGQLGDVLFNIHDKSRLTCAFYELPIRNP